MAVIGVVMVWSAARRSSPSLVVVRVEGAPSIEQASVTARSDLAVGQWLSTDRASEASISLGSWGEVSVLPESRVRLVATGKTEQRLELAKGTLRARVTAPPRLFVVSTPSVAAVDLGCAYTLHVDEGGAGELRVTSGAVSLEGSPGTTSGAVYVPGGAIAHLRTTAGPGLPFFEDAPQALKDAVASYDAHPPAGLGAILDAARIPDSLTLWHLLPRATPGDERRAVFTKLAGIVAPPEGVTVEDVEDRAKMTAWMDLLETDW